MRSIEWPFKLTESKRLSSRICIYDHGGDGEFPFCCKDCDPDYDKKKLYYDEMNRYNKKSNTITLQEFDE